MIMGMGDILPTMGGWIINHTKMGIKDPYKHIMKPCPKINQGAMVP